MLFCTIQAFSLNLASLPGLCSGSSGHGVLTAALGFSTTFSETLAHKILVITTMGVSCQIRWFGLIQNYLNFLVVIFTRMVLALCCRMPPRTHSDQVSRRAPPGLLSCCSWLSPHLPAWLPTAVLAPSSGSH